MEIFLWGIFFFSREKKNIPHTPKKKTDVEAHNNQPCAKHGKVFLERARENLFFQKKVFPKHKIKLIIKDKLS